jgi:hypothetical protein
LAIANLAPDFRGLRKIGWSRGRGHYLLGSRPLCLTLLSGQFLKLLIPLLGFARIVHSHIGAGQQVIRRFTFGVEANGSFQLRNGLMISSEFRIDLPE